MSKKMIFSALLVMSLFISFADADEIINSATIKEIILPTGIGNSETAIVSFNIISAPSDSSFTANCVTGFGRVKFPKSDKQILSLLMFASALNKKVGFFYNPNGTTLGDIPDHGSGTCELKNIWILPDH